MLLLTTHYLEELRDQVALVDLGEIVAPDRPQRSSRGGLLSEAAPRRTLAGRAATRVWFEDDRPFAGGTRLPPAAPSPKRLLNGKDPTRGPVSTDNVHYYLL